MNSTMTEPTASTAALVRTKRIFVAALATTALAALAGIGLLAVDPAAGSDTEAILGLTAAASGLLTAALVVAAVISAHVAGLWSRVPNTWRYVVWAFLAVGVARTIWSQISHLM